jgi:hypothetical protein
MGKYLVVANQTLGGEQLMGEVRRRMATEPSSFYVVVPNTRPADMLRLLGEPGPSAFDTSESEPEHRATLTAQSRLHQALAQLRAEGADAQGSLGDAEPLTAIADVLAQQPFDEIIISTLPTGISRWLRMDLPHRAGRKFNLPVTTIITSS